MAEQRFRETTQRLIIDYGMVRVAILALSNGSARSNLECSDLRNLFMLMDDIEVRQRNIRDNQGGDCSCRRDLIVMAIACKHQARELCEVKHTDLLPMNFFRGIQFRNMYLSHHVNNHGPFVEPSSEEESSNGTSSGSEDDNAEQEVIEVSSDEGEQAGQVEEEEVMDMDE